MSEVNCDIVLAVWSFTDATTRGGCIRRIWKEVTFEVGALNLPQIWVHPVEIQRI